MQLMLKIPGGSPGNALLLRQGQYAKIGRTEWADFCVPHDESLAEFHFSLECSGDTAQLVDLQSGKPTWVNGKAVSTTLLHHGDQIRAGETTFVVELSGVALASADAEDLSATSSAPPQLDPVAEPNADETPPQTLAEWCAALGMSEEAQSLLGEAEDAWQFIDTLASQEMYGEALQLAGALLPAPQAVAWGSDMVISSTPATSAKCQGALDAVSAWLADPSETNRRACEVAAQATDFEGPASWIALGAFWSAGSMAPAGQPEVLPPLGLGAKAIAGALMLAATSDPQQAQQRYLHYLETAKCLAQTPAACPSGK